jgi:putative transposase
MKRSRFTEQQVVRILAEGDRGEKPVTELCREQGISSATYYNWRRRFRGMGIDEVREYRKLKRENARLKKLLADREMEIDALQEVMRKEL